SQTGQTVRVGHWKLNGTPSIQTCGSVSRLMKHRSNIVCIRTAIATGVGKDFDGFSQPVFQLRLGPHDLISQFLRTQLGEGPVRYAVRLNRNAVTFEFAEIVPAEDRLVWFGFSIKRVAFAYECSRHELNGRVAEVFQARKPDFQELSAAIVKCQQ